MRRAAFAVSALVLAACGSSSSSSSGGGSDCQGTVQLTGGMEGTFPINSCGTSGTGFALIFLPLGSDTRPGLSFIVDPGRKLAASQTGTFPVANATVRHVTLSSESDSGLPESQDWAAPGGSCTLTVTGRGTDGFGHSTGTGSVVCSAPFAARAPNTAAAVTLVKADFTAMLP